MTNVFLTETLKCDGSDPSISEAMFLWTMSSVNAHLPRSFKIPSVCIEVIEKFPALDTHTCLQIPAELHPIPNPHRRNWAILRESIRSGSKKRRYHDSEDDADSSDPPVIVTSTLPLYKTPAPMTKKRKLGSPVILKENAVAGPSPPRQRKASFVPNAGRVPTLMQNNLPNTSKLRLMGSVLTKHFFPLGKHLYNFSCEYPLNPVTDANSPTHEQADSAPAPFPPELSPKSTAELRRVNMALAVVAPRPPSGMSSSLSSSRPKPARHGMATHHLTHTTKARSPIQSPPQRPIVASSASHQPSQFITGAEVRPAISFAPPSADELSFPHHLRSKSAPVPAVPPFVAPPMKKTRFSAGTTPAHPNTSRLRTPRGSVHESAPPDDERIQAWNSTVRKTAIPPPSVEWDPTAMDLASPAPCTAESPAATNPFDKLTDPQLADLSHRNILQSNPAIGRIWQPVWDTSTLPGPDKQHNHGRVRERQVGTFARMKSVDPETTRQQAEDFVKRVYPMHDEADEKREFGGPWLFAPKNVRDRRTKPDWNERPSVAPRFAGSREEVYGFEMGLFAASPAGVSRLESPAPTPQPVDLDRAFEMEMESSMRDIVRRETKMTYEAAAVAEADVKTPEPSKGVASPSSSQNSELAFQPIPRSIDGLGDYAIQATIYGKEFFLNEEGSIIDHGDFMEFEGEFSQETSSLHEEALDGDGDSEMSPGQQEVRSSTSRRSDGSPDVITWTV